MWTMMLVIEHPDHAAAGPETHAYPSSAEVDQVSSTDRLGSHTYHFM